jgi:hypothetical protein
VEGKKPTERLLATIAYKDMLCKPSLLSGTTFTGKQSTAGSSSLTPTSRLTRCR